MPTPLAGCKRGRGASDAHSDHAHAAARRAAPHLRATAPREAGAAATAATSGGAPPSIAAEALRHLLIAPTSRGAAWLDALRVWWLALRKDEREQVAACLLYALLRDAAADARAAADAGAASMAAAPAAPPSPPSRLSRSAAHAPVTAAMLMLHGPPAAAAVPTLHAAPPLAATALAPTTPVPTAPPAPPALVRSLVWCHLAASAICALPQPPRVTVAAAVLVQLAARARVDARPLRAAAAALHAQGCLFDAVAHCAATAPCSAAQSLLNALHAILDGVRCSASDLHAAVLTHGTVRVAQWLFLDAPSRACSGAPPYIRRTFAPPPLTTVVRVLADRAVAAATAAGAATGVSGGAAVSAAASAACRIHRVQQGAAADVGASVAPPVAAHAPTAATHGCAPTALTLLLPPDTAVRTTCDGSREGSREGGREGGRDGARSSSDACPWFGRPIAYCAQCAATPLLALALSAAAAPCFGSDLALAALRARARGAEGVARRLETALLAGLAHVEKIAAAR